MCRHAYERVYSRMICVNVIMHMSVCPHTTYGDRVSSAPVVQYDRIRPRVQRRLRVFVCCHGTYLHASSRSCILRKITTGSQYTCATSETACRRRDKFLLRGTEPCEVTLPNGDVVTKSTALCCESVCFVRLDNLQSLRQVFPAIPGSRLLRTHAICREDRLSFA